VNTLNTTGHTPLAHAWNPSDSGGRDQEDHSSKPAWANSSVRPYLKNTHHKKRAGGVAQSVGPEFKPHYCKKKKQTPLDCTPKIVHFVLYVFITIKDYKKL
jgi:hypothetical protein